MATLAISAGVSTLGLSGFSLFAANVGAVAVGSFIDSRLFGSGGQNSKQEGPRLKNVKVTNSSEGEPINRLYGRQRVGGNLIWATQFREEKSTEETSSGGKGGGGGGATTTTTTYTYFCSFAVALSEGNDRAYLGRVYADGNLLDTGDINFRFYPGSDDQEVDPLIREIEGENTTPAYRGISYLVFEDLNLTDFGNRIPQITAELVVPISDPDADTMENLIEQVNLIPSTGEVAYGTTSEVKEDLYGNAEPENNHLSSQDTNFVLSMNNLNQALPFVSGVNLVISWFGNDLRMSECKIKPKVEQIEKRLLPKLWKVGGNDRYVSEEVSKISVDGQLRPVYGGTPSDHSVVEAIRHLADVEEKEINFYPFLLMDVPSDNDLPDPYGAGAPGQPAFPWRGRITLSDPSRDGTDDAQAETNAFFGSVDRNDFNVNGTSVSYEGSEDDEGFRRMILHYAHLCAATARTLEDPDKMAKFYVGTEMRGVTTVRRSGVGRYPGVTAFVSLMNEVRRIFDEAGLPNVEISYAADWSEYHSHRPDDGSGDVFFNMDEIWSNPNCDFIAIDNYFPLSDWRDGQAHEDYGTTDDDYGNPRATSIYERRYLRGQIEGGELWDYFYASEADRETQTRTPIRDSSLGKRWVFQQKNVREWWKSRHFNRPSGSESGSPTNYDPSAKRIVFSEYGTPAVDKGPNQPNVFYDPKSSESFLPYFSNGQRDDQIQRIYYEAMVSYWLENSEPGFIDASEMCAWTWDARPYPAFPFRNDIWSDGENYELGHWLNGRAGSVPLGELVRKICGWVNFTREEVNTVGLLGANTTVTGYLVDDLMSPRDALGTLSSAYLFDGVESGSQVRFSLRSNTGFVNVDLEDFVANDKAGYSLERSQETELPVKSRVSFVDEKRDYNVGTVGAQIQVRTSDMVAEIRYPIVMFEPYARTLSEIVLQESWNAIEKLELSLPLSFSRLEPGDGILAELGGQRMSFRIDDVSKGAELTLNAESFDTSIYDRLNSGREKSSTDIVTVHGRTVLFFMDLPLVTGEETRPWAPRVVAYQGPFPPAVNVFEDIGEDLNLNAQLIAPTQIGALTAELPAGPHAVIDEGNVMSIEVNDESFEILSRSEEEVRRGANSVAVRTSSGRWEIMKFVNASFQGGRNYLLFRLFRGQLGTYPVMEDPLPIGAPVVFLDENSIEALNIQQSRKFDAIDYRYGPSTYAPGSAFYQNETHVGEAVGQLPYPVTDIQFFKKSENDVKITWKRQTRFGGESYDQSIVPLNEEFETYEIDLFDEFGEFLETVTTDRPEYLFVEAPRVFTARIYQISTSVGRGRPEEKTHG